MPKWLLYSVAAVASFAGAILAYLSDRIVIPFMLVLGGICFIVAAVGAARESARKS